MSTIEEPRTDEVQEGRTGHRFTFGLWTVGNPGRDPFGGPTRADVDPVDSVHKLAELGAWGVSLHDDDLIPMGSSDAEKEKIVARFKDALDQTGLGVGMATTNLFGHPAFKDGAFTSNDRGVRRAAIGKAMRFIDIAAQLNAEVYVFWGGREGTEVGVAKDPRDALERYREAINVLSHYVKDSGYDLRFAMEPKPNEPRGDIFLPTVGHALHFIETLDHPEMVGVNPEFAHETMAGLSFHHAIGHALWANKLFHIDLNSQRIGRYDQDFRFGAEDLKESFLLVRLLERAGYAGPLHFDAHSYRNENAEGVWDFAAGCMATYRALAEKAAHFDSLPDVQAALEGASQPELALSSAGGDSADTLKAEATWENLDSLAERGYYNEKLDQILVEVSVRRPVGREHLIIRGARENNLKGVDLDIPKQRITVFTGVSGSGKSSIVFDTIAAESQRLLNDTMPAFVQTYLPSYGQPDADELAELSPAIIVDQKKIGGNARSTVGTYTDAYTMLRVLFSRLSEPSAGISSRYSFNDPRGMCPECEGLGRIAAVDEDALVDPDKSLNEGAIDFPNYNVDSWYWSIIARLGLLRPGQEGPRLHGAGAPPAAVRAGDQGRADVRQQDGQLQVRRPGPQAQEVRARQGAGDAAAAPARGGGADRDAPGLQRL